MEKPINQEITIEVLKETLSKFDDTFNRDISEYLKISSIDFNNDITKAAEHRKVLLDFSSALDAIVDSIPPINTEDTSPVANIFRNIYSQITSTREMLTEAPDVTYSSENLAIKYGGKEKIPGGTRSYEYTVKYVERLDAFVKGIKLGISISQ